MYPQIGVRSAVIAEVFRVHEPQVTGELAGVLEVLPLLFGVGVRFALPVGDGGIVGAVVEPPQMDAPVAHLPVDLGEPLGLLHMPLRTRVERVIIRRQNE